MRGVHVRLRAQRNDARAAVHASVSRALRGQMAEGECPLVFWAIGGELQLNVNSSMRFSDESHVSDLSGERSDVRSGQQAGGGWCE